VDCSVAAIQTKSPAGTTITGATIVQGVGGLGGTIANLDSGLARGYASASTDTGHVSTDPNWGHEPRKGN